MVEGSKIEQVLEKLAELFIAKELNELAQVFLAKSGELISTSKGPDEGSNFSKRDQKLTVLGNL